MSEKFQQQGFNKRVGSNRNDKQAICDYLNDELNRHVASMLESSQRDRLKADMEKVKKRRREREKNKLNAKLLQHERSKRINRGEDPKVVDADLQSRIEMAEAEEKVIDAPKQTGEDKGL